MAIINVELKTQNLTPENGSYTFTTTFYNATTDALLNDSKYPQNQVHTTTTVGESYVIPVNVADGVYTISNVKIKVRYKDKVYEYIIPTTNVSCNINCSDFPILSIVKINNNSYTATLSKASTQIYNWKLYNSSSVSVADSQVALAGNSFNISIPNLPNGNYLFELTGSSCKGKTRFPFEIVNNLANCQTGPTLLSILEKSNSSLKFQFNGVGVYGITWRIKQGTNIVRNGVIKHISQSAVGDDTYSDSTPTLKYTTLPNGSYALEIEGETCKSEVTNIPFVLVQTEDPLAFITGSPSVSGGSGTYTLDLKINKSATYNVIILNTTTGVYYQQGNVTFTAGSSYLKSNLPTGDYYIKVGTIESNVKIQNSGITPCVKGPTISSILSATTGNLQFQFDATNVTAINWRIKQNGNVVRNSVVYPTNNSPFITFNTLAQGAYTLEIEGNNCQSQVSSSSFTISDAPPQANNAGVKVTNVNGKYIGIINGRSITASVTPSGAIKLSYPEFSTAEAGGKQVKGWLLGNHLQEIPQSEITALRSENGLILPNGNYHFYLYYAATDIANTYDQLGANSWPLFLNPAVWPTNSRTLEELIIEVKTNLAA